MFFPTYLKSCMYILERLLGIVALKVYSLYMYSPDFDVAMSPYDIKYSPLCREKSSESHFPNKRRRPFY